MHITFITLCFFFLFAYIFLLLFSSSRSEKDRKISSELCVLAFSLSLFLSLSLSLSPFLYPTFSFTFYFSLPLSGMLLFLAAIAYISLLSCIYLRKVRLLAPLSPFLHFNIFILAWYLENRLIVILKLLVTLRDLCASLCATYYWRLGVWGHVDGCAYLSLYQQNVPFILLSLCLPLLRFSPRTVRGCQFGRARCGGSSFVRDLRPAVRA